LNKQSKEVLVAEMHDKLLRAQAIFAADFRGMTVGQATDLRNELRKANVEYKVVKNTLLEIASKGTDKEGLNPFYKGPTAIALSYDDPVAAAKVLSKFNKDATVPFKLKGGVLTGKAINVNDIQALADLPSREVLLARMLGSMQAPASNFVRVLAAVPAGFVRVLDAVRVQKEAN
jgi:large subunit ribosomal protein L10